MAASDEGKAARFLTEQETGVGNTYCFKIGSLDESSTFAFYYNVANKDGPTTQPVGYFQFITEYYSASGQRITRITTAARNYAQSIGPQALLPGLDQEACAAAVAKLTVFNAEQSDSSPTQYVFIEVIHVLTHSGIWINI